MILEDFANLFSALSMKSSAADIGRIIGRERKAVYRIRDGEGLHLDLSFVVGLHDLGYELKLVELATGEVYEPPEVQREKYAQPERPQKKKVWFTIANGKAVAV